MLEFAFPTGKKSPVSITLKGKVGSGQTHGGVFTAYIGAAGLSSVTGLKGATKVKLTATNGDFTLTGKVPISSSASTLSLYVAYQASFSIPGDSYLQPLRATNPADPLATGTTGTSTVTATSAASATSAAVVAGWTHPETLTLYGTALVLDKPPAHTGKFAGERPYRRVQNVPFTYRMLTNPDKGSDDLVQIAVTYGQGQYWDVEYIDPGPRFSASTYAADGTEFPMHLRNTSEPVWDAATGLTERGMYDEQVFQAVALAGTGGNGGFKEVHVMGFTSDSDATFGTYNVYLPYASTTSVTVPSSSFPAYRWTASTTTGGATGTHSANPPSPLAYVDGVSAVLSTGAVTSGSAVNGTITITNPSTTYAIQGGWMSVQLAGQGVPLWTHNDPDGYTVPPGESRQYPIQLQDSYNDPRYPASSAGFRTVSSFYPGPFTDPFNVNLGDVNGGINVTAASGHFDQFPNVWDPILGGWVIKFTVDAFPMQGVGATYIGFSYAWRWASYNDVIPADGSQPTAAQIQAAVGSNYNVANVPGGAVGDYVMTVPITGPAVFTYAFGQDNAHAVAALTNGTYTDVILLIPVSATSLEGANGPADGGAAGTGSGVGFAAHAWYTGLYSVTYSATASSGGSTSGDDGTTKAGGKNAGVCTHSHFAGH